MAGRLAQRGKPSWLERGAERCAPRRWREPLPAARPAPPPAGRRGRLPPRRRPAGAWHLSQRPHINTTPGKAGKCIVPSGWSQRAAQTLTASAEMPPLEALLIFMSGRVPMLTSQLLPCSRSLSLYTLQHTS